MAKTKKIVLQADVIVDDKGTMKKSAKGAHSVDRRLKGAARTSSNASKNFSKMSQGISGGLVPAYATLAASIFALDAVYRGLKNAADLRILQQGQLAFAQSTGQAMNVVANAVQRATQMQVSFKEASQASAIAAAAGFGTDQIVQLAEAANAAAKVLGRSVPDAFDRMVRGVVKAEPEVLDELGIILRLDDAARRYAEAMNVSKESLTTYEKSQAVLNDVLAQAESKFAHVADAIDPNPWSQLGVAMEKVKDTFLVFISGILEPVATFLSENATAAIAGMLVFISSIMKGLIPSYSAQATAFVASQNAQQLEIDETILKIKALEAAKRGGTEALGMAEGGIQKIAKGAKGKVHGGSVLGRAQKGEVISARSAAREIKRIEKNKKQYIKLLGKQGLKDYKMHLNTIKVESKVTVKKVEAGWKTTFLNINLGAQKMALGWKTVMRGMQRVTTIATRAMSVAMGAIGWIGMIYMVVEALKAWREQNDEAVIAQKKFDEKTTELAKTFKDLDVTMVAIMDNVDDQRKLWKTTGQEVEYFANALKNVPAQQTIDYLKQLGDQPLTAELLDPLTGVFEKMSDLVPVLGDIKDGMSTEELIKYIQEFQHLNAGMQDFAAASRAVTESQSKFNRAAKERVDSLMTSKYKKEMTELITTYSGNINLITQEIGMINKLRAAGALTEAEDAARVTRLKEMTEINNKTIETFTTMMEIRVAELKTVGDLLMANERLANVYKWQKDALKEAKIVQLGIDISKKTGERDAMAIAQAAFIKQGDNVRAAEATIALARLNLELAIYEKRREYIRKLKNDMVELETTVFTSMASGLQKGLEDFLSLKANLGEMLVTIGKSIASGMAKTVSEQLTEKIMGKFGQSKEQKIKEAHIKDLEEVYATFNTEVDKYKNILETAGTKAMEDAVTAAKALGLDLIPTSLDGLKTEIENLTGMEFTIPGLEENTLATEFNTDATWANSDALEPEYTIQGRIDKLKRFNPKGFLEGGGIAQEYDFQTSEGPVKSGIYGDKDETRPTTATALAKLVNDMAAKRLAKETTSIQELSTDEVKALAIENLSPQDLEIVATTVRINETAEKQAATIAAAKEAAGRGEAEHPLSQGMYDLYSTNRMKEEIQNLIARGEERGKPVGVGKGTTSDWLVSLGIPVGYSHTATDAATPGGLGRGTQEGYQKGLDILDARTFDKEGLMIGTDEHRKKVIELANKGLTSGSIFVKDIGVQELLKNGAGAGIGEVGDESKPLAVIEQQPENLAGAFGNIFGSIGGSSGGWFGAAMSLFGAGGGYVTKKGIRGFAKGGSNTGTDTIPAMLSPGETVLTPSQLKGVTGGSTVVNVNMGEGGATISGQQSDSANAAAFGKAIAAAVNREIGRQKRVGGILYR